MFADFREVTDDDSPAMLAGVHVDGSQRAVWWSQQRERRSLILVARPAAWMRHPHFRQCISSSANGVAHITSAHMRIDSVRHDKSQQTWLLARLYIQCSRRGIVGSCSPASSTDPPREHDASAVVVGLRTVTTKGRRLVPT